MDVTIQIPAEADIDKNSVPRFTKEVKTMVGLKRVEGEDVIAALPSVARGRKEADLQKYDVRSMVAAGDVQGLQNLLKNDDWRERVRAVKGLAIIGDARVIEPLIRGLMDKDDRVKYESARQLGLLERRLERVWLAH
jgi:HEAT repeat protein